MINLFAAINDILENTEKALVHDNAEASYRIAPLEELIDNLCGEYKRNHIDRVQNDVCQYSHGFVFNDMLTDLERIGDHCSNLGMAIRIKHSEVSNRHGSMTKQEIKETHGFEKYYGEYVKKYTIHN